MKKLLVMVLALCMLASCAYAASFDDLLDMLNRGQEQEQEEGLVSYTVPEMALSVKVPEEFTVLYDGSSDADFAVFGLDRASAMESFRQNDTYVLIFPGVYTHEIDLVMTENSIASFSELSEDTLNQSATLMDTVLSGMGCTVEKHDLYTVNGYRYIRTWYTAAGTEGLTYVMQYYTIENNKAVVYRMFAYTGAPISQEMETVLYDLVANVQYD